MKKPSLLSSALKALTVPTKSVALAWLGQAGFVLKSPRGHTLALDPYLSNSCAALGRSIGVNMERMVPAPLKPADLVGFDALLFSHSHQDHLDPETIVPYRKAAGQGPFIAPQETAEKLESWGVPSAEIRRTWPNHKEEIGDFAITATFAVPLGADDLTHVGFLIKVRGGPVIYFTGDTDYNDILPLSIAPHKPDIMVTVINPAFRNLSPAQAAHLAKAIGPRWVIPCHHDLFPDNSLPDRLLRTNLFLHGMAETFCPLRHGEIRVFQTGRSARSQP